MLGTNEEVNKISQELKAAQKKFKTQLIISGIVTIIGIPILITGIVFLVMELITSWPWIDFLPFIGLVVGGVMTLNYLFFLNDDIEDPWKGFQAKKSQLQQLKATQAQTLQARDQFVAQFNALMQGAYQAQQSGNVMLAIQQYADANQFGSASQFSSEFQPALKAARDNIEQLQGVLRVDLDARARSADPLIDQGRYDEAERVLQPIISMARDGKLDGYARELEERIDKATMLKRLEKMFKASQRLKIDDVCAILNKERAVLMDLFFTWSEKFGFKIDGDYLVVGDISDFGGVMADLDKQFASWGAAEASKHGKI